MRLALMTVVARYVYGVLHHDPHVLIYRNVYSHSDLLRHE